MNKKESEKINQKQLNINFYIAIVSFLSFLVGLLFGYILFNKTPQVGEEVKIVPHKIIENSSNIYFHKSMNNSLNSSIVGEEYPKEDKNISKLITPSPKKIKSPRLVIILDDVSHPWQLKAIKSLPFKVTPSIFPPSQMNMNTPKLAIGLKHYLIHLPLESGSMQMNKFYKTLFVRDSASKIMQRVKEIRRLFPTAHYVNNHTGSVFTSNYKAMYQLFGDLKKEGFVFIDSRTTNKTVVPKVAKAYHRPYISRDVFLDNVQEPKAIIKQLKEAIEIAKKRGYAIAIGHPHPATLKALNEAKPLLKGVKPIYFDEFYRSEYGK